MWWEFLFLFFFNFDQKYSQKKENVRPIYFLKVSHLELMGLVHWCTCGCDSIALYLGTMSPMHHS
jgi:hypothetical protein